MATIWIERRGARSSMQAADGEFCLEGIAAAYNSESLPIPDKAFGKFTEKISPGAFNRNLKDPDSDVTCLLNHDPNVVLGRQANGTLQLKDSPQGLRFKVQLNRSSQQHRDLYESVKRG